MGIRIALTIFALLGFTAVVGFAAQATWLAPEAAQEVENPLSEEESAISAGKKIFEQQCFVCHGTSGKGDGPAAKALKNKLPDFTDPSMPDQTDGELFWKISQGNAPMPKFESVLPEEQRWQLVSYIRSFAAHD